MASGVKCLTQVTVGLIQRPPILIARQSRSTARPWTAAVSASSRTTGTPMLSRRRSTSANSRSVTRLTSRTAAFGRADPGPG
jgi:hypothetical protein